MARKILLADDSVTAQNMGRKILADAGYEVIAVNNGSAALKKIAELKPDLVILDVYMPGYSGLEVCQLLKDAQETMSLPVLLSVGKLEPFKPEEAQRACADAFIVKPFEASELLSALSKLEDKIVPRPEPSRPGRMARAVAATEGTGGSGSESGSEPGGLKNRIEFPRAKSELETSGPEKSRAGEKIADESSVNNPMVYNPIAYKPMNRDPRTVMETAAEGAAEKAVTPPPVEEPALATTNFPAPPDPASLLRNVTPQEVAAIAAAMAQMEGGSAPRVEAPKQDFTELRVAAETAKTEETKASEAPAITAAAAGSEIAGGESAGWLAVPVPLDPEEAAISLEREMRQAYAEFALTAPEPEPAVPAAAIVQQASAVAQSPTWFPKEAVAETPEAPIATAEAAPVQAAPEPEQARPVLRAPVTTEDVPTGVAAEMAPIGELAELQREPVPVEQLAAAVAGPVADAEIAPEGHEMQSALEAGPVVAEQAENSAGIFAGIHQSAEYVAATEAGAEPADKIAGEHQFQPEAQSYADSDVVKRTAAAWASWRQVRDTNEVKASAEPNPREFEMVQPAPPDSAAMAVAAGAEQMAREVSTQASDENPADVASIVDSVLADLRPRLMAEISRKIAAKK